MSLQAALGRVCEGRDLAAEEMDAAMRTIMSGEATPAQVGALLTGLRLKGETVTEIAAAAAVMRELATRVDAPTDYLVDTCGTGGDASGTFNISTAAAFAAAAAGARVAKHGNRSVSSSSGSADVLMQAGVSLELTPDQVGTCLRELGIGFLFAPRHHGATRHAAAPRKELGFRTIFNLLGPLTNPAGARRQVLGVFDARWLEPMAEVLRRLGSEHVMVVHAADGLDEISIAAPTDVAELDQGEVRIYRISPEDLGVRTQALEPVKVANTEDSLMLMRQAFSGQPGPAGDIVAVNAGAAIYVAGLVDRLSDGVATAREALAGGAAAERLEALAQRSTALAEALA